MVSFVCASLLDAQEDRNGMFLTRPVSLDCFPGTRPAKGLSWQLDALLVTMLPVPLGPAGAAPGFGGAGGAHVGRASCGTEFLSLEAPEGSQPVSCQLSSLHLSSVTSLSPRALPRAPPFHVELGLLFPGSSWWQGQARGGARGEGRSGRWRRSSSVRGAGGRAARSVLSAPWGRRPGGREEGEEGEAGGPGRSQGPSRGMAVPGPGGDAVGPAAPGPGRSVRRVRLPAVSCFSGSHLAPSRGALRAGCTVCPMSLCGQGCVGRGTTGVPGETACEHRGGWVSRCLRAWGSLC